MLEIYSEVVRDLLVRSANRKSGLPVRQDPKYGFYGLRRNFKNRLKQFLIFFLLKLRVKKKSW